MRRLEVRLDWGDEQRPVGTLAEHDHRVVFEYASDFLARPLPISPFKLPVRPGLFEHAEREFAELFGVFNDSLPDGWGLLLMDREFRRRGASRVSPLDRLAYIGTRAVGALTYHPTREPLAPDDAAVDLRALAEQSSRILEGSVETVLPELLVAGGSPAGARPKVLVGFADDGRMVHGTSRLPPGFRHYIVKFHAREDGPHTGAVEAAYARMAEAAGVQMPATRLFRTPDASRYFGAERFDRAGNARLHVHTLSGLLHASHRLPSLDYEGFLRATFTLTRDVREVEEAFRRMVFNVFAHVRDDHVKNHSFIMDRAGQWRLSPAYDVVFSDGPGGEHTMSVAGEARNPAGSDMLRVAEACGLDIRAARDAIGRAAAAVQRWPHFAQEADVPGSVARRIGAALARLR